MVILIPELQFLRNKRPDEGEESIMPHSNHSADVPMNIQFVSINRLGQLDIVTKVESTSVTRITGFSMVGGCLTVESVRLPHVFRRK